MIPAAARRLGRWTDPHHLAFRVAPWLVPVLIAYGAHRFTVKREGEIIGAAILLGVGILAVRNPDRTLVALTIFLPLQTFGFGLLLHLGFPSGILRPLGGTKEFLGVCLLIAAIRELARGRSRLSALDKAALAYIGVAVVYLVAPGLFSPYVTHQFSAKLLAWRADCGYVLLFIAVRHAPISAEGRRNFVRAIGVVAVIVTGFGLWQLASPHGFTNFATKTADAFAYQERVLGSTPLSAQETLTNLTTFSPLRVTSIFYGPFDMADFYVVVFAVHLEQLARGRRHVVPIALCASSVLMIFASRVRADGLAIVVLALLALVPAARRPVDARIRLVAALAVAALLVVPSLGSTRFVGAQGGNASSSQHLREIDFGILTMEYHPLGLGIGNVAGTAQRFDLYSVFGGQSGSYVSDNSITQVGDELGLQTLIPWLIFVIATLVVLRRRSRTGGPLTGGAFLALLGVLLAGQYHQVFLTYPVPWTLWALVGLASRPVRADLYPRPAPLPAQPAVTAGATL